jgi:signal transduction histidine kinase
MKFTAKVFFCTIIVIALAMGAGGYFLINSTFAAAIGRETKQALDESAILCFALESITLNLPLKYEGVQDKTVGEIAASLETGRFLQVSDERKAAIYAGPRFGDIEGNLSQVAENAAAYKIIKSKNLYYIYTAHSFSLANRLLYLETLKDITAVFAERDQSIAVYRGIVIATIAFGACIMYFISLWLTKPIRSLAGAARDMASGNYGRRARLTSSDELGLLTGDFNYMADSLQDKIRELRSESSARERFISAFSHELKTPLTAIIGYADMMRSYRLNEEDLILSADYIYKEGRRLEQMSLRLLEILVLRRNDVVLADVPVSAVFDLLAEMFAMKGNVSIVYDDAFIRAELSLLKTVLTNITDNALKASDKNLPVEITGRLLICGYKFTVLDYGIGIAEDDIGKLTQAFYKADKSRSGVRSSGSGLGLTLCAELLELFGSELEIESRLGEYTRVSFTLPLP